MYASNKSFTMYITSPDITWRNVYQTKFISSKDLLIFCSRSGVITFNKLEEHSCYQKRGALKDVKYGAICSYTCHQSKIQYWKGDRFAYIKTLFKYRFFKFIVNIELGRHFIGRKNILYYRWINVKFIFSHP